MTDLKVSKTQAKLLSSKARFRVACWARRVGKTQAGCIDLLTKVPTYTSGDNVCIVAKNSSQVRSVWLPMIREIFPQEYIEQINLGNMTVSLVNGVVVHLKSGADDSSVDSMRGMSLVHVICDECPFWRNFDYAWNSVILPALADRNGTALLISSPNGKEQFYQMFQWGQSNEHPEWDSFHADYTKAYFKENVALLAETARATSDSITFAREWMASFEGSGKNVFHAFSYANNVKRLDPVDDNEVIRVGIDFNIGIMGCVEWVKRAGQCHVISETVGATNTEELCKLLRAKYPARKIIAYPDPTGRQRKTSAAVGQTDFTILQSAGFEVYAKKSTQSIIDGVNSVNTLLKNADGESNLFIDPQGCPNLVTAMDVLVWKEDASSTVYGNPEHSHIADALRYPVDFEFGLNKTKLIPISIKGL